jgi:hypothetical protein
MWANHIVDRVPIYLDRERWPAQVTGSCFNGATSADSSVCDISDMAENAGA